MRWPILATACLLASVGVLATVLTAGFGGDEQQPASSLAVTAKVRLPALAADGAPIAPPAPTPAPLPWSVTIAAGGDVMLARSIAGTMTEDDPAAPFAGVKDKLLAADIALVNLECAVSTLGEPEPKGYTFRAPPIAAQALALAGIDAVSLANNHALDYGPEALVDTIALLSGEGVLAAGAGSDLAAATAPAIFERKGARIAILSFADVPSEAGYDMRAWEAAEGKPGIAWAEPSLVTSAVASIAAQVDIVIVMFHFGVEFASEPIPTQRAIARMAIDAGASLVIGSHPHVLQEVEEYNGGLIAYSLGNFVFDGFDGDSNQSAILQVTLTAEGISAWEMTPAYIGGDGLPVLP